MHFHIAQSAFVLLMLIKLNLCLEYRPFYKPPLKSRPQISDLLSIALFEEVMSRQDYLLNQLHTEKDKIELELTSAAAITNSIAGNADNAAGKERETRLRMIDMRIKQVESLLRVIVKSSLAVLNIANVSLSYNRMPADDVMKDIRERNAKIREELIEASFEASKDYEASKEQEVSLNKDKVDEVASGKKEESNNIVGEVMANLDKSVEKLENSFQGEDKFSEGKKVGKLETVVKISDKGKPHGQAPDGKSNLNLDNNGLKNGAENSQAQGEKEAETTDSSKPKAATTIIDAENNQYVLIRSNDPSLHFEDIKLFHDIVLLICVAYFLGTFFDFLKLPTFFGFVGAGMLLGPPGLNKLEALVQLETISQFGVLLILFHLGVDLSLEKLQKHWRITVVGGLLMFVSCVFFSAVFGWLTENPFQMSVVIGCIIGFSSTTIVLKSLNADVDKPYGRIMIGILILQDVILGLVLAIMPVLAMNDTSIVKIVRSLTFVLCKSLIFIILSWLFGKISLSVLSKFLKKPVGIDLHILGYLTFCFLFIWICEYFDVSVEVGCFMAGVIISHSKSASTNDKQHSVSSIDPLRDFFGCLFFASIGIHIYPSFLINEAPLLILLTISLLGFKILIAFFALRLVLKVDPWLSIVIGVGLSQVSEFAFVLASRAKIAGILSKDMYYIVLGVTSLSLLLTPFAWKTIQIAMKYKPLYRFQDRSMPTLPLQTASRADFRSQSEKDLSHGKSSLFSDVILPSASNSTHNIPTNFTKD